MFKVYERIYIGCDHECFHDKENWVTVHACKIPCHQQAVGYRGSLQRDHPNYLVLEKNHNLFLNMIDPPKPLFMMPLFTEFLRFAKSNWEIGKNIFIHCNKGESRAPSLALLFMAKRIGAISNESYFKAKQDFLKIYPYYMPGEGIQLYLHANWNNL